MKIDATYDIPYGGGTSKDGKTVYIDKRIPEFKTFNGRRLNVWQSIATHESAEIKRMLPPHNDGYKDAHKDYANPAEKKYVLSQGVSWKAYDEWAQTFIRGIEHSGSPKLPPDLYTKPYGGCRMEKAAAKINEKGHEPDKSDSMLDNHESRIGAIETHLGMKKEPGVAKEESMRARKRH